MHGCRGCLGECVGTEIVNFGYRGAEMHAWIGCLGGPVARAPKMVPLDGYCTFLYSVCAGTSGVQLHAFWCARDGVGMNMKNLEAENVHIFDERGRDASGGSTFFPGVLLL